MSLLELVGLRKQFGELVAVNDVNLTIEEGEIHGLIGPNGSGKTTLFNLITGFIKPTSGKVIWKGQNVAGQGPHSIAKAGIARTFQITTLLKDMTALENVVIASHLHTGMGLVKQFAGLPGARKMEKMVEEKAMSLLDLMGILHVKDSLAGDLPHGHQRALSIAIALATEPTLLLLDEPVSGMNPVEKEEMMNRVKKLRENGLTIMLVEHDMKTVMGFCMRIDVMNFGKKIAEGNPEEISKNNDVIEAYLGVG